MSSSFKVSFRLRNFKVYGEYGPQRLSIYAACLPKAHHSIRPDIANIKWYLEPNQPPNSLASLHPNA